MKGCNGMCLTASDIGLHGNDVAYPHPLCSEHGGGCEGFDFHSWDAFGRAMCNCRAYQTDHTEQLTEALVRLEVQRELAGGYVSNAETIQRDWATKTTLMALQRAIK